MFVRFLRRRGNQRIAAVYPSESCFRIRDTARVLSKFARRKSANRLSSGDQATEISFYSAKRTTAYPSRHSSVAPAPAIRDNLSCEINNRPFEVV